MDTTRGAAILLILVQHAVTVPRWDGYEGLRALALFNEFMSPYRMPFLLVLSGLLLPLSLAKPLGTYAVGKVRRIIWPLAFWTGVLAALSVLNNEPIQLVGPRHLWFLVVLAVCYLIGPVTRWIPAWLIAAAMFGYSVLVPAWTSDTLHYVAMYGAFFMVGSALVPWLGRWQATSWPPFAVVATVALAWAALQVGNRSPFPWPLAFAMTLVGITALLWVAPRVPRSTWLEWVGRNSMAYYAAHAPAMIAAWWVLRQLGITHPAAVSITLLAAGFAVSTFLARASWAQWMFTWPARR